MPEELPIRIIVPPPPQRRLVLAALAGGFFGGIWVQALPLVPLWLFLGVSIALGLAGAVWIRRSQGEAERERRAIEQEFARLMREAVERGPRDAL